MMRLRHRRYRDFVGREKIIVDMGDTGLWVLAAMHFSCLRGLCGRQAVMR